MKKSHDSGESTKAVNDLIKAMTGKREAGHYMGMAIVSAEVGGSTKVDHREIEVSITFDGTNFSSISIFWEDHGIKKYKALGLFGKMNTQYQNVRFVPPHGLEISGDSYVVKFQYKPAAV